MQEILDLLQNDARLTAEDIATMTGKSVTEVTTLIAQMEKDGIILKYTAVVNQEKIPQEKDLVRAVIEIQVSPEREHGFDALAERIYRFPQVKSLHLMSGGYDLQVVIEGKTLKDVAFFVSEKLATLNGVKSTKTHFVLKTYKENNIVYVDQKKDRRQGVTA
ncbi:MAG TPA: Lrp/AsnC family transcriptional regulator [Treponemataceae bacterium]|nr:Lrp/AsnC family transcriptional regulator [Treponemataceae bacterium]